jgi:S-layer glycoprotein
MTKRLTIALVAVALFVLMAVMPVSAGLFANGTIINQGATIFIGEEGLNVTHALNGAYFGATCGVTMPCDTWNSQPNLTQIGWWASAADIYNTAPSKTIDLKTRYPLMTVAPSDFVGYTGNWYLLGPNGRAYSSNVSGCGCTAAGCIASMVFSVADPSLDLKIWDFNQNQDVTGKSVPQGEKLGFRIDTNMYSAVDGAYRNNVIDACPQPNTSVWDNKTIQIPSSCVACGTQPLAVEILTYYQNWIGWATWSNVAGQGCYSSSSQPLYYNGGHFYPNYSYIAGTELDALIPNGLTYTQNPLCGSANLDPAVDGFIDIKLKDESNAQIGALYNKSYSEGVLAGPYSILKNFVNNQPWWWGSQLNVNGEQMGKVWDTGSFNNFNQYAYPVGTYTVSAESKLNKMKDNYKQGGADYTGKTVSQAYTITLVSDTVKIEANKDSVVRSKSFSVTVTGRPSTSYVLWVKGTSTMQGTFDDQPPLLVLNQVGVRMDSNPWPSPATYPTVTGLYQYENGAGLTVAEDVSVNTYTANGTREYANITTSTSGTRTIEFMTTNWTKAQKYTIRVEQTFPSGKRYDDIGANVKNDEVDVKVEKGAVTIVAAGDQSYYLGEEIKFSGTNTETYQTYLFIVGPNLKEVGSQIQNQDPRHYAVVDGVANTFKRVDVNGDNTWSWKWGTSNYALDAGTYTIYAVSQPNDKDHLENAAYGTVSIIIKKPFVSATASQSTVAKGDRIYITGTAEGDPSSVQIWILGKNFYAKAGEAVNSDASFKYEVRQETTRNLASGQYFVVVQHPMQNNRFDIDTVTDSAFNTWVQNLMLIDTTTKVPTRIFKLGGAGSLQGSDAAEALVQGINDANVDDTYTKLQFLVEEPVIRIDPIGDKHVGDKFTISAQTNLAVDDEVLVQVYSSSFKPTQKSQSGEFSGATGTVKVTKGDSGMNKITFDVDSSTFKPDEYIVTEAAVIQEATGTALFNVLETAPPTPVPTTVVTTVATPVPTTIATAAPTPIPTTKSPGYGALIALIGLGAVAFIVVRRH